MLITLVIAKQLNWNNYLLLLSVWILEVSYLNVLVIMLNEDQMRIFHSKLINICILSVNYSNKNQKP